MPPRTRADSAALAALLAPGRAVASHAELRALGMPSSTITDRIRATGPWQRILPGVVLGHRGIATPLERRLAALRFAGDGAVLTGLTALAEHGVALPAEARSDAVHVLVPDARHRRSYGFAQVHRTVRLPVPLLRRGLPCAGVARAVVDASRELDDPALVREVVARSLQQGRCSVSQLVEELRRAARQRSAAARSALEEVGAGVRSLAEGRLRELFAVHGVPAPEWNAVVEDATGAVVARVDALWRREGVAVELDSMAWHLSPADYQRTQARQRELGLVLRTVLPVSPRDVELHGPALCRQVVSALEASRRYVA